MKLTATAVLAKQFGIPHPDVITLLTEAGIKPRVITDSAKPIRLWGPDAAKALQAVRNTRDAKRAAAAEAKAEAAVKPASSVPPWPYVGSGSAPAQEPVGFSKGQLGTIERQLAAIMGSLSSVSKMSFADDDMVVFSSIAASTQGVAVTAADVREMVVALGYAVAGLTNTVGRIDEGIAKMQATLDYLADASSPLAGPEAEAALTAAMAVRDEPVFAPN